MSGELTRVGSGSFGELQGGILHGVSALSRGILVVVKVGSPAQRIVKINVRTGSVVARIDLPSGFYVQSLEFDRKTHELYGFGRSGAGHSDGEPVRTFVVTSSNSIQLAAVIQGIQRTVPGLSAFDPLHRRILLLNKPITTDHDRQSLFEVPVDGITSKGSVAPLTTSTSDRSDVTIGVLEYSTGWEVCRPPNFEGCLDSCFMLVSGMRSMRLRRVLHGMGKRNAQGRKWEMGRLGMWLMVGICISVRLLSIIPFVFFCV